jgi:hypothetical protein
VPNPGNPLDWDRYSYVRNNPLRYVDPSGHCLVEGLDGKCDFQKREKKTPKKPKIIPPGAKKDEGNWQLVTPIGDGVVTWYVIEKVTHVNHPDELDNQAHYRMQGSVQVNGVNYFWKNKRWNQSTLNCSYANSVHCVTPYSDKPGAPPPTGAVEPNGSIPVGADQYLYVSVNGSKEGDNILGGDGLLINLYDGCPKCIPDRGVDILTTNMGDKHSYNGGGNPAIVYLWLWVRQTNIPRNLIP